MKKQGIEYAFNEVGMIAFVIIYRDSYGRIDSYYKSPFVFESTDQAYDAAIIELSGK